jgi:hypothetical protein
VLVGDPRFVRAALKGAAQTPQRGADENDRELVGHADDDGGAAITVNAACRPMSSKNSMP